MVNHLVTREEIHVKYKLKNFWFCIIALRRQKLLSYLKVYLVDWKCLQHKFDVF